MLPERERENQAERNEAMELGKWMKWGNPKATTKGEEEDGFRWKGEGLCESESFDRLMEEYTPTPHPIGLNQFKPKYLY